MVVRQCDATARTHCDHAVLDRRVHEPLQNLSEVETPVGVPSEEALRLPVDIGVACYQEVSDELRAVLEKYGARIGEAYRMEASVSPDVMRVIDGMFAGNPDLPIEEVDEPVPWHLIIQRAKAYIVLASKPRGGITAAKNAKLLLRHESGKGRQTQALARPDVWVRALLAAQWARDQMVLTEEPGTMATRREIDQMGLRKVAEVIRSQKYILS